VSVVSQQRRLPAAKESNPGLTTLNLNNILLVARPQDWLLRFLGTVHLPMLVAFALLGLWLTRGKVEGFKDRLVILYSLFIVHCGISIFWAANNFWAYKSTLDLVMWLFGGVLPMITFVGKPQELRRLMSLWVLLHVFVGIYAQFVNHGAGPGGYLGDENDVALALCMALPYAYLGRTVFYKSAVGRLMGTACALMIAVGVVASESRGGFVALLVTALAIIWFSPHRVRNLLVVAVLGGALYLGMSQAYLNDMSTINDKQDSTRVARLYSWGRGWEMFLDNPVIGVGAGNYPWRVAEYQERSTAENVLGRSLGGRVAHSMYFTLFPETGLVGTALFFAMLIIGVNRLRRIVRQLAGRADPDALVVRQMAVAGLASVFGLLSGGAFVSVLYYPHFWYWLGIVVMLSKLAARLEPAGTGTASQSTPAGPRAQDTGNGNSSRIPGLRSGRYGSLCQ